MNQFTVRPTEDRSISNGRYLVRLSPEAITKTFGWPAPKMIVVTCSHAGMENVEIAALAWLESGIEDKILTEKPKEDEKPVPPDEIIQMDQSVRQALGLDYYRYRNVKVSVATLHGAKSYREWFSRIVGRRVIYCRPGVLQHKDIEKGIVRAPTDALRMLGIESGDGVVLIGIEKRLSGEYWLKRWSAAALTASTEYVAAYDDLRKRDCIDRLRDGPLGDPDMTARYPDIGSLIGQSETNSVYFDLNTLYLDKDARDYLLGDKEMQRSRLRPNDDGSSHPGNSARKDLYIRTVQCAQPLLVFRSPSGAIAKEIMAIGIAAAALELNIVLVAKELFPKDYWDGYALLLALCGLIISAVGAFAAAFWKTRSAVR